MLVNTFKKGNIKVKINLGTIIKISAIVDIVGGVALHLIPLIDSLLYNSMAESCALHYSPLIF